MVILFRVAILLQCGIRNIEVALSDSNVKTYALHLDGPDDIGDFGSVNPTAEAVAGGDEVFSLEGRPFMAEIFEALNCLENDYLPLFSLCLIFAMQENVGEYILYYSAKKCKKKYPYLHKHFFLPLLYVTRVDRG